mmetsp:Transcript_6760/g.17308  ORF Transcript_6760/g.17308 Transcript_6760/m.17308 type:complete len:220 (-) Transcript_6760:505-1164(-)
MLGSPSRRYLAEALPSAPLSTRNLAPDLSMSKQLFITTALSPGVKLMRRKRKLSIGPPLSSSTSPTSTATRSPMQGVSLTRWSVIGQASPSARRHPKGTMKLTCPDALLSDSDFRSCAGAAATSNSLGTTEPTLSLAHRHQKPILDMTTDRQKSRTDSGSDCRGMLGRPPPLRPLSRLEVPSACTAMTPKGMMEGACSALAERGAGGKYSTASMPSDLL